MYRLPPATANSRRPSPSKSATVGGPPRPATLAPSAGRSNGPKTMFPPTVITRTRPVAVEGESIAGAAATTISARPAASPTAPGNSPKSATAT